MKIYSQLIISVSLIKMKITVAVYLCLLVLHLFVFAVLIDPQSVQIFLQFEAMDLLLRWFCEIETILLNTMPGVVIP